MSPEDERTWSAMAHLSALAGLVGLMPVGALVIWLVYRDRSPRVGFHALQALLYQAVWLAIWVVGAISGVLFVLFTLGLGLILVLPLAVAAWVLPMAHGCYAAYRVSRGEDYRYPVVGRWVGP
ncbi:hypothetical protein RxyAA322_28880 [Rubrobacter xylanophilus]|uniref:DUF4870 domain-containing protein n=1 Tax=Rubrobacter xylanophilus TaxID=49319 RepID=A0A510HMA0_9ACTN|nr:DUF4870 domain-containing protein [Rubrobacter xylanophilus]BBL81034.1 hypothetical protein RxyAA322_28880 [Rubrobacter xylanophilus]